MSNKVDVIYQNGEVVDFCWYGTNDKAQVVLYQNGENSLIFRFCRSGGKSEDILKAEDFSHAQVLLSHRDRLLAASEGNIFFEEDKILFTGDVLFNLCIGGLFEGTPQQMFESLQKIKSLDEETIFYPGHEYTKHCLSHALNQGGADVEKRRNSSQNR